MEAGDVLLFHSLLPHGTATNRTPEHRWGVQYHYAERGAAAAARAGGGGGDGDGADSARLRLFASREDYEGGRDVTC